MSRSKIKRDFLGRDRYLAGDVGGHGRRGLGVGVGILGDEARVVGGDAAESVGARRGHLEKTDPRTLHQYITSPSINMIYLNDFHAFTFF